MVAGALPLPKFYPRLKLLPLAGPACRAEDGGRRYLEGVSQKLNSPDLVHSFLQLRMHCLSTLSTVGPSTVNPVSALSLIHI